MTKLTCYACVGRNSRFILALAELSTRQIAQTMKAKGMSENKIASKSGGSVAKKARVDLELKTGRKVVSGNNFLQNKNIKKLK